ncbi:sulfite dehydrogenase [Methylobacterium sp. Leaf104]|uniref:sulfite dehydrogenase n=1 Tax=Methylobacterium TaxID=407 RepID=UPI0006FC5CED|nr:MULTISPECIES: sulfite dehydrogenase [Methylobacterium]KQP40306.1 sulfite dehydrogenase [Methylobacterium sp. Leaf104]MCI9882672.1 sulfite dehydrogenase [Methylobacterium goesingense]
MPPDALRRPAHRRGFLRLAGATASGIGIATAARAAGAAEPLEIPPWSRTPGAPVASPAYGQPSPFERLGRRPRTPPPFPGAASTGTPLQHLHGIITPNGLHFERHHAGVLAIDPERHRLAIHGLAERPLVLTMDDLLRMPAVSRIHFLECSGNTPWLGAKPSWTLQESHGLLSCSEWTGVELATLLDEVGVRPGAAWILAEGADASGMTRSLPLDLARDGAILAYVQNGERLRPEQGYPLRLFVPGVEGNLSVKWLRRLKIGDQPFQTREETAKYTDLMPDGTARQFTFVMEAKSVITAPSGGERLGGPGFREIRGLAWTRRGRIARVEVSTDGGARWQAATLEGPILPRCLTRFRLPWRWEGGPAQLLSRATDETGYVQPDRAALVSVRGTQSFYHNNATFGWRVAADGGVSHAG